MSDRFDTMKDYMDKLDRNFNRRICEILSSNAIVKTPCNNNLFVSSLPRLKNWSYAEHALAYRVSCETYTPFAGDDSM